MAEMKEFLYRIQPTRLAMLTEGPTPQEADIISQHFYYLENLTAEGRLILAGRTLNKDDTGFGIVIFKATSDEEAEKIVNNDPAVIQDVMRATLFPYRVALISEANTSI
jgi:uncharacterized protein YciI